MFVFSSVLPAAVVPAKAVVQTAVFNDKQRFPGYDVSCLLASHTAQCPSCERLLHCSITVRV